MIGNSIISQMGNGAIILTYPDSPLQLSNVASITRSSQIGLIWTEGDQNGGAPVIDYTINYGESIGSFNQIIAGITSSTFTVIGLTPGTIYKFRVQARNIYGLSEFSAEVLILAAQVPDATSAPTTTIVASNVLI